MYLDLNYLFNVRRRSSTAGVLFESLALLYSSIMLFVVLRRMISRCTCDMLWMSGVETSELIDVLNGDEVVINSKNTIFNAYEKQKVRKRQQKCMKQLGDRIDI